MIRWIWVFEYAQAFGSPIGAAHRCLESQPGLHTGVWIPSQGHTRVFGVQTVATHGCWSRSKGSHKQLARDTQAFLQVTERCTIIWQVLVNVVPKHRWRLTRKSSRGVPPFTPPQFVGRCLGLRRPVFGVMSKISRMIWVKDQHAQHWSWTLSRWRQGRAAPLPPLA